MNHISKFLYLTLKLLLSSKTREISLAFITGKNSITFSNSNRHFWPLFKGSVSISIGEAFALVSGNEQSSGKGLNNHKFLHPVSIPACLVVHNAVPLSFTANESV